jgi:GTP-binding protein HflX
VLKEIGADKIPQLQVFNKIDLLLDFTTRVDLDENNLPKRVWLSAVNSIGFSLLFDVLQKTLLHDSDYGKV